MCLSFVFPLSSAGQFSNLYATFVFDRRTSYTILQVYVPSYMIVLLSFMALWLPQNAVPARVSLGITTVLTIVYFLGKLQNTFRKILIETDQFTLFMAFYIFSFLFRAATVNSNMPRVSYMKAIDYHLFVSFGFVFAIMLEYVILLNVKHRKKPKQHLHKKFQVSKLRFLPLIKVMFQRRWMRRWRTISMQLPRPLAL